MASAIRLGDRGAGRARRPGRARHRSPHLDAFDKGASLRRPGAGRLRPGPIRVRAGCSGNAPDRHTRNLGHPRRSRVAQRPRYRRRSPDPAGHRRIRPVAHLSDADGRSFGCRARDDRRTTPGRPAGHFAGGWSRCREHRPATGVARRDPQGDRHRADPGMVVAGDRIASTGDRPVGHVGEPVVDRRRVRRRPLDLPERDRCRTVRLRIARVPRRVGPGVLLRDDLRHRDGLHGVPARLGQRTLGTFR